MKLIIAAFFALCMTGAAYGQGAEFIRIGSGGVSGVSPNGLIATGTDWTTAFVWTEGTGQIFLGEGEGYAVTNDTMVVGRFRDPNTIAPNGSPTLVAGYWKNGSWTSIGGLPGVDPFDSEWYSHAYGVSDDGSTIVGMGWQPNYRVEAFYWTEVTGIVPLGQDGDFNSRANDASADGSIIVGWDGDINGPDRRAYMWDPEPHFLGSFDPVYPVGEASRISPNGQLIVGNSVGIPFVWTPADSMQPILDPNVFPQGGHATDVNDDGFIVGGAYRGAFNVDAFFLEPGGEAIVLKPHLQQEYGIDLTEWSLQWLSGISSDASVLGGSGTDEDFSSFQDAYIVRFYGPTFEVSASLSIDSSWLPVSADEDTIVVNVEITNLTADEQIVPMSLYLVVPNGQVKQVLGSDAQVTLQGNETVVRNQWQRIKADGPPGTYTAVVRWGEHLENKSALSFEKLGTARIRQESARKVGSVPVLDQNSPNPFNPSTTISFSLPAETHVTLEVFNTLGQRVAMLVDGVRQAGSHSVVFNGSSLASGVYLYRLQTPGFVSTKKFILTK